MSKVVQSLHCGTVALTKCCSSICKSAIGALDAKSTTGKRGPPANVAFGGTLTATRPRVPAGTLGNSQPGSPARARPRQVTHTPDWHRLDRIGSGSLGKKGSAPNRVYQLASQLLTSWSTCGLMLWLINATVVTVFFTTVHCLVVL